jgi:hypothetical protein
MSMDKRDNFKIINDSLTGKRPIDETTFSSVAVLAERMERLKKNSEVFEDISFSPEVEELALCEMISAIC